MQAGPVELLGQALEVGRGRDQHRIGTGQRTHQIFVEEPAWMDQAAGSQRPQHAEQQAIDVLVRHRAMHLHAFQLRAERSLQCVHLARQLVHALVDRTGLSGAAGGEHAQLAGALVQRLKTLVRCGVQRRQQTIIGGHIACETTHLRLQRLQRGRQIVGSQEHPLAGMPGTEQRSGKGHRIIEIQGPVTAFGRRKRGAPGQYALAEAGVVDHLAIADANASMRPRLQQQPVQGNPLSHARAPPSPAAAPATHLRTTRPSSRTPTIRCRASRPGPTRTARSAGPGCR